ncbi:uncharacterized protein LOC122506944 [Leptopilina heterotoma]|uniref:uncharacterized protein LOC122506944 n=1 Tax=Leptopilina heterotoma TaxID=63436 RepID=UPI001CA8A13E|nr:uncharacterized protein LOC122506944 [Leptopilina heterotoma]
MCYCQLCIFSFNQEKLLFLFKCIKNDWHLWASTHEGKILCYHSEIGRNYTILYIGYIFSALVVFIGTTFVPCFLDLIIPLNETRLLKPVYPAKFFFDENKYFNFILIHGCVSATYHLSAAFCFDSTFAVTTQHACGLFAIVSYRVKNVSHRVCLGYNRNNMEKEYFYKDLCYSINYHNYAIR